MGEVRALTADWPTAPPLVFLVEALVKGFSAGPEPVASEPEAERSIVSDPEMQNDRALQDIAYQAPPNQLPILRGGDPGLPKAPPIFDLEVMRAKNAERRGRAEMWMKVAAMRKG